MKLKRLELRDFMSYSKADVDFSDVRLAVITGTNGAGKSAILEAITYALFGQTRTASHDDVVRRNTAGCTVRLTFELDDATYSVERHRSLDGRGSSDLRFAQVYDDGTVLPLTEGTIKETQERIEKYLGFGFDVFNASALLRQGQASAFSSARPAQRKELLYEMLGLDEYAELEQVARASKRTIVNQLELHHSMMDHAEQKVGELQGVGDDIENLQEAVDTQTAIRDNAVSIARTQAERAAEIKAEHKRLEQLGTQYANAVAAGDDLDLRIISERERLKLVMDHELQREEIEDLYNEFTNLQLKLAMHEQLLKETQPLETAIEIQRARLVEQTKGYEDLCVEAGELRKDWLLHNDNLVRLYTEERQLTEAFSAYETAFEGKKKANEAAKDGYTTLLAELNAEEQRLALLGGSVCPTCQQTIDDPSLLSRRCEATIERVKMDVAEAKAKFLRINDEFHDLDQRKGDTGNALKEATYAVQTTEAAIRHVEEQQEKVSKQLTEMKSKLSALNTEDFCHEERARIAEIGYDPEAHEQLVDDLSQPDFADIEERHTQLLASLAKKPEIEKQVEELKERREEIKAELNAIDEETEDILRRIGDYATATTEELNRMVSIAEKMVSIANDDLDKAKQDLADAKAGVKKLEEYEDMLLTATAEAEQAQRKIDTHNLLINAVGKNGAPALIIENALPAIQNRTNEILEELTSGVAVSIKTQAETKTGSIRETMDVVVYYDGIEAPIETLSGGERFRADLALRLAISQYVANSSSAKMDILAIDEGFGSQDSDGQESIVECFERISGMFATVLVITHVGNVAESLKVLGSWIDVSKTRGTSMATVHYGG